ncbi:hypothetical protein [Flavihumibacter solisilvae]|uniref:Uncharacterized protein n=1 Tax=Flavihumibacter solisilvae TaxID=1349421 RepID=A0A0C1IYW2_9BACT|nr:hypothetical protein [Flavihumibacter solisilvae]KIC95674.1 hypothetical protein OI18_05390 [Flavihumibacter solisilvae]
MHDLKKLVKELFEQESLVRSLDKEIKNTRAQYHHLILKNSEKIYSDQEMINIYSIHEKLVELESRQEAFNNRTIEIKSFLCSLVKPLNGGRWIHETDDFMHPKLEFWIEDDELKYARLNGRSYD